MRIYWGTEFASYVGFWKKGRYNGYGRLTFPDATT